MLVLTGAALLFVPAWAGGRQSEGAPQAGCSIQPRLLDVRTAAQALVVRIELFSSDGLTALPSEQVEPGVWISSVTGVPLPPPDGHSEGIGESLAARSYEDLMDVRGGIRVPNGLPELVARFVEPSDGDPATKDDGNAGDVLAMLMGMPDGESAEVCIAGRLNGSFFQCCDSITVRNRGLRDIPRGILPLEGSDLP